MTKSIIHLEDDSEYQGWLAELLEERWFQSGNLVQVATLADFEEAIKARDFALAILDGSFPRNLGESEYLLPEALKVLPSSMSIKILSSEDLHKLDQAKTWAPNPTQVTIYRKGWEGIKRLADDVSNYMKGLLA